MEKIKNSNNIESQKVSSESQKVSSEIAEISNRQYEEEHKEFFMDLLMEQQEQG